MSSEALDPLLRQFAEKRLGRPLEPGEEQALLERLPGRHGNQPAPAAGTAKQASAANPPLPRLKTRQEAREQVKHFLQLNQQKAYEKMRGILQTIDAQNETTLGMLASEQQKVSGVLDAHEPPGDAQASGTADIQDSTRQALAMIGEQLTGLIRQEIDTCFRQYVDSLADRLAVRLDAIDGRLQSVGAGPTERSEPTAPGAAATAAVHDTAGPASME
ncbi:MULTISPECIES: hypothetical protein [Burkholderia]|uniref:Uncharacterized protein n=1 Tax=Burkholderia pyrrocinia TaxID=60550 RepID=A0A318IZ73_BURPY|nr:MULTISPECIES: hypothetical protein [Burkholderia]PXX36978.1 hypothetical protein NA66_1005117 [Burkholderia pyrrocinia]SFW48555.1 hypothetical protein SAMN03159384_02341 [Burkholderia sp. NFACC33-1]SFY02086.1 hypothetical protein SAMN03159408_02905 [Burkholderia sp. NFPP32]